MEGICLCKSEKRRSYPEEIALFLQTAEPEVNTPLVREGWSKFRSNGLLDPGHAKSLELRREWKFSFGRREGNCSLEQLGKITLGGGRTLIRALREVNTFSELSESSIMIRVSTSACRRRSFQLKPIAPAYEES